MISQGEGCREDVGGGGGWQHTRQTLEKSPTSKLYTTWAHILSDRNVFAPQGGGGNGGVQCPWGFSCFFIFHFFGGHLPQTSGFRSAKEILVLSFATQPRAFILNDRYTPPGGGRTTAGSNAPGAFPVFFWWSLAPDLRFSLGQANTHCVLRYTR